MAPATEWSLILVRYGEIGIKSQGVRLRWERRLVGNIEHALERRAVEAEVTRTRGRVFVHARDVPGAFHVLQRTFGVVSASVAERLDPTMDAMRAAAARAAADALTPGTSFAVRVRRSGDHPFSSMEAARDVGSAAYRAAPAGNVRVDLTNPDVTFHFEVRPDVAYFYRDVVPGPGGLPVGTAGRVVAVVEDARGALAAWLMMKRGTTPLLLVPSDRADAVAAPVGALAEWAPTLRAASVTLPEGVARDAARRRAFLVTAAGQLAARKRAHAVVLADGLTGVAALSPLDARAEVLVLRPLTGYAGDALNALAEGAGLPAEDEPRDVPDASADVDVDRDAVRDGLGAPRVVEVAP